jgi:hypothetical protein
MESGVDASVEKRFPGASATYGPKECSLYYQDFSSKIYNIRERLRGAKRSLSKDSCCFTCFLPTISCFALRDGSSRSCFDSNLMLCLFILCLRYYQQLGLEEKLRVKSFRIWNSYSLEKVFFNKVFINKSSCRYLCRRHFSSTRPSL